MVEQLNRSLQQELLKATLGSEPVGEAGGRKITGKPLADAAANHDCRCAVSKRQIAGDCAET